MCATQPLASSLPILITISWRVLPNFQACSETEEERTYIRKQSSGKSFWLGEGLYVCQQQAWRRAYCSNMVETRKECETHTKMVREDVYTSVIAFIFFCQLYIKQKEYISCAQKCWNWTERVYAILRFTTKSPRWKNLWRQRRPPHQRVRHNSLDGNFGIQVTTGMELAQPEFSSLKWKEFIGIKRKWNRWCLIYWFYIPT